MKKFIWFVFFVYIYFINCLKNSKVDFVRGKRELNGDVFSQLDHLYKRTNMIKKAPSEQKGIKKSLICDPHDNSGECICQRSCGPNNVQSFLPCQCVSSLNLQNTMYNPESVADTCRRMCMPNFPSNYNPCSCINDNINLYNNENIIQSSPFYYTNNNPFQPNYNAFDNGYNIPDIPPVKLYDNSKINSVPIKKTTTRIVSCKKSCFPYPIVETDDACRCNFKVNSLKNEGGNLVPQKESVENANSRSEISETLNDDSFSYPVVYDPYPVNDIDPIYANRENLNQQMLPVKQYLPDIGNVFNSPVGKTEISVKSKKKNYRFIGCFIDKKKEGRDLKINLPIDKLTIGKCINKCRSKQKRFAGLQYGYLCFCGSRFGRYGRAHDPASNCNTTCVGDPLLRCGGPWYNSIYSTDGQLYSEEQFSFMVSDPPDELKAAKEEEIKLKTPKQKKKTEISKEKEKYDPTKNITDKDQLLKKLIDNKISKKKPESTKKEGHKLEEMDDEGNVYKPYKNNATLLKNITSDKNHTLLNDEDVTNEEEQEQEENDDENDNSAENEEMNETNDESQNDKEDDEEIESKLATDPTTTINHTTIPSTTTSTTTTTKMNKFLRKKKN